MLYPFEFRMIQVQPFRFLVIRNKINIANPRRKLFNTAEPILKIIPIAISYLAVGYGNFAFIILCFFFLP